jgi:cytochrome c oxidase assembly protein subunit 15
MDVTRVVQGPRALRRWAVATLVANVGIVVTGGLVRLTGSGLGCPTWPRCTADSFVSHPALGVHGAIEFGNRLLTFVLIIIALLTFVAAMRYRDSSRAARGGRRRDLRWLSAGLALGIPAQAIIGGISVLYQLNPYIVSAHLLVSMILISLGVWLVRKTRSMSPAAAGPATVLLTRVIFGTLWIALILGTLVTGSGPHAGDAAVARNGLDGLLITKLHAGAAYATVAATLVAVARLRSRAALLLLAVEILQAAIGVSQYVLGLPVALVAGHLLGASLATAAAANLMLSVRRTNASQPAAGADRSEQQLTAPRHR